MALDCYLSLFKLYLELQYLNFFLVYQMLELSSSPLRVVQMMRCWQPFAHVTFH
jgi:hypothetical protein